MATILENMQKARFLPTGPLGDDLPTTFQGEGGKEGEGHLMGMRKRLSSFSGKIQPISFASAKWVIRRGPRRRLPSGSPAARSSAGGTKKLGFVGDLEMNKEEAADR
ncbi:hypothetical protein ZWY2020_043379 [Hordeum vulgare]|nr:hypothetical protein ZWY2020_043379 [Hordeum vulgare]